MIPQFANRGLLKVHVPNTARRSVIFIGDLTDRGVFRPRATAFLVAVPGRPTLWFPYLVTAEHVVVGMADRRMDMYCRVNLCDGTVSVEPFRVPRWWHHPDAEREPTDVAVAAVHLNFDQVDHDCIPMPETWGPNPLVLGRQHIGLGDETFTIGLFRRHAGTERNIPIVRIGNVAALPEEPVYTKWGCMRAYLIEMRSIAGLSGSPVFANLPSASPLPMGFMQDTRFPPKRDYEQVDWSRYRFLGLIHGHFDIPNLQEDSVVEDDADGGTGINTGIGVVIPAEKICETLYQPDLVAERRQVEEAFDRDHAATPDAPS